ncbi:probable RNA-binding protein ARP1 isoform X2 [Eutrema salsugineum]|uniref:probable RNA-binding protein ARP1 isoform X2 n=1 Tax=Eutrema salsugineum TaxID=72664 RepID=UPI000CED74A7|nr:probable RNA-binding protein ARP1 isoform X2 [Eutrema salsugineum]
MTTSNNVNGCFGDTKLTKVFVGGLAWDTHKEAMYDHFIKYGDILEAVIISDRLTRRSKGYGFVTFKDAEAAKRACEDSTPIINGRRANCNIASLGGRLRRSPSMASPDQGSKSMSRATSANVGNQAQWYYPAGFTHQQQHQLQQQQLHHQIQAVPFYGYPSSYVAPNMAYNQKVGYVGGSYMNGYYAQPQSQPQPQYYQQHHMYGGGRVVVGASPVMPLYTVYPYHQTQAIGFPQPSFSKPHSFSTPPISVGGEIIMKKAIS